MYLLMNKNKEIGQFSITEDVLGNTFTFTQHPESILPIGFQYIENWIENRKASKHNGYLRKLMQECGCDTATGFIQVTHAASINDTFWVKTDNENIKWEDVSFYRNEFNETVSKLAFEGIGLYGLKLSSTSPELSTSGSFRKCWKREYGEIYLYKRGSTGARNAGLEPYCEYLGSELARALTPHAIQYELVRLHGELASKCKLFTNETYGYTPIARFDFKHASPSDMMRFYAQLGSEDQFRRMIVLDALTFNVDRHLGNHGVLVDNETQTPIRMAPIFDMNLSMLPYVSKEEFQHIGDKLQDYAPLIGEDFTRMGQQALTPAIRADLINLKGFQFTFRGDETFPEWRVRTLENLVNTQIDAVLSKEKLYTKEVFVPERALQTISEERQEPKSDERGEHLAQKYMQTGSFLGYDIEERERHAYLLLFPKKEKGSEIAINLDTKEISVELNGQKLSMMDIFADHPTLSQIMDELNNILVEPTRENREKTDPER